MNYRALIIFLSLFASGCSSPFFGVRESRINRPVNTVWVGANKFVYVPGDNATYSFTFETSEGHVLAPGLMYTDGGSIPRFAQGLKGFSPWDYGPAYIVHDWVFYARNCAVDHLLRDEDPFEDRRRFADVYRMPGGIVMDFHASSRVLAEAIWAIMDDGEVRRAPFSAAVISSAVDSAFALALWNETGACARKRVAPEHIALVWVRYNGGNGASPPLTWKLSGTEIAEARRHLPLARCLARRLDPNEKRICI